MVIKLTQKEYSKVMGVSQPAISYRIKNKLHLPGIVKKESFSRFYILHFDNQTVIKEAKKYFNKK